MGKENLREEDTIFVRCFEEGGLEVAPQLVIAIADEYERGTCAVKLLSVRSTSLMMLPLS